MVRLLAVQRHTGRAAQPAVVGQLGGERAGAGAADLELADDRALGFEHLHARGRKHDPFVRQRVVAPEADPQVRALDPVERHTPVLGEARRADGQRIDAAIDPTVGVVDEVEDRAYVLAASHVLAAVRAVDAVGGRDLGLALGAFDPLLSGLIAPDGCLGELLAVVAEVLDEAHRRVEHGVALGLLAQHDGGEAFELAVPLLDDVELLVAEPQAVLLHLVGALELLPVADLEGQAHRSPAELAGQQRAAYLADELERLLGLDDGIDAVDELLLLEDLAQQLGASVRLQGEHLGGGGRAGADADAEASGLDLLPRDAERQDVAGYGRAHARRALTVVRAERVMRIKSVKGVPRRDQAPQRAVTTLAHAPCVVPDRRACNARVIRN